MATIEERLREAAAKDIADRAEIDGLIMQKEELQAQLHNVEEKIRACRGDLWGVLTAYGAVTHDILEEIRADLEQAEETEK